MIVGLKIGGVVYLIEEDLRCVSYPYGCRGSVLCMVLLVNKFAVLLMEMVVIRLV